MVTRKILAQEIPLLGPCQTFCRDFFLQDFDRLLDFCLGIGLVSTSGSANCLTRTEPVLGLPGIGACPLSIIRSASCRRHSDADVRCNVPLNGSKIAASRSPRSSETRSRSHADAYRSLALYSAWYAGLEGSSGGVGTLAVTGLVNAPPRPRPLPGASVPRGGGRSLIFNQSCSLINPRRALCSSPVQSEGKSSRPKRFNASSIEMIATRNELGHRPL